MRLFPQSLFGRLLLLLLGGLIVAQLLSAGILLHDRGLVLRRAVGADLARRIAAIVELLEESPAPERRRLVAALDTRATRITLSAPWQVPSDEYPQHAALLTTLLRRQLSPATPLRVSVFQVNPRDERFPHRSRGPRRGNPLGLKAFQVQAGLSDGGIVTFRHRIPEDVFAWPYRLLLILAILLASVAVLAVLAVRWLTRPLVLLASAAEELGRDIHRPPLAERGPLEVRRAARAFNTMQTRLIRYIQDRGRILAAISHDLKTPITRLRLRTELLDAAGLSEKFRADLDEMEAMVKATLEFMRGTEHNERVVPIDINSLLEALQQDTAEAGAEIPIQGKAQCPFRGRPLALKRCLVNLIDNARHYGQNATIRVNDTAAQISIAVCDEGPGIPEGELDKVFEPFYRLERSRSRNTGGTGLGLGIARNIARAHGGELVLRNRAEGGLEALLALPR